MRAIMEDGDRMQGPRQEGAGETIAYSGEHIVFDYQPTTVHPDLMGLLCLTIFYPFIGKRVIFPMPVSPRLEAAFRNRNFTRQFRFDNVDPSVEVYSGSKMALSFGGGADSSAVRVMFPEAYIVHEAHWQDGGVMPSEVHRVVQDMGLDRGRVVKTNQRYVSKPSVWHGWPCAFATTLLTATDHGFGIILMGAQIESTILQGGTRYWDRFGAQRSHGVTGNCWQSAFNAVGLPAFSPVCGASSFLTMELSLDLLQAGEVFYCTKEDGSPCLRCPKCLRRDIIRAVVDPGHLPQWAPYDRKAIHSFLESDPLSNGHVFSIAGRMIEGLPDFISSRIQDLPKIESDWPMRVHPGAFDFCDERWRPPIRERVLKHLDPMQPADLAELEKWSSARRVHGLTRIRRQLDTGRSRLHASTQCVASRVRRGWPRRAVRSQQKGPARRASH